jgi:hypothetical protein
MGNVGTNLINAVKNELIPIVFKINNTHEFCVVASVEVSQYEVTVRVWKKQNAVVSMLLFHNYKK